MSVFKFISQVFKSSDPVIVMPFGGFANEQTLFTCARVLEDERIQQHEDDSTLKNLWNSFKRLESDEVGGATVRICWADKHVELTTDSEGYVYLQTDHHLDISTLHHPSFLVTYQLLEQERIVYQVNTSIHVPHASSRLGIISDVDDTILQTGVTSLLKWRVLVNALTKHSHQRRPLEGAEAFYQLLHKGQTGKELNPVFYVSNSPWNIYDYITAFLEKFKFPKGPLLLRDINQKFLKKSDFENSHKHQSIERILQMYPSLPFLLIGDAGEIDIDIYTSIAQKYPGRIKSIFIRAVKKDAKTNRVRQMMKENSDLDTALIANPEEALSHARSRGYIA